MNIMFVINDTLITPPTSDSILPGITRESALILARDWGLNVEERPITVTEVIEAIENGTGPTKGCCLSPRRARAVYVIRQ